MGHVTSKDKDNIKEPESVSLCYQRTKRMVDIILQC